MVYAYVRVSTQMQDTDSQLFQIETYCNTHNMHIDKVYSEKVSGVKQPEERKLGTLLRRCKEGDLVIVSELSRLGRTLYMIMEVLNLAQKKRNSVYTRVRKSLNTEIIFNQKLLPSPSVSQQRSREH